MGDVKADNATPVKLVNPDGTTNWRVVFDDPAQGIVAAVGATQSVEQLRSVMTNIALLLFKRKRDDEPRAEFLNMINNVIDSKPDDSIEAISARIISILDAEKNLRIEKAALHAKNKAASQSIERRRNKAKPGLMNNPLYVTMAIGGFLIVALLALLGFYHYMAKAPAEQAADEQPPAQQEQSPATAEKPAAEIAPEIKAPPKKEIVKLALKPVLININKGGSQKRLSLVPLLDIDENQKITPVCDYLPRIMEGILFRLNAMTEQGRDINPMALRDVSANVVKDINARAGSQKIGPMILVDSRKLPSKIVLSATKGCERVILEKLP